MSGFKPRQKKTRVFNFDIYAVQLPALFCTIGKPDIGFCIAKNQITGNFLGMSVLS